MLYFYIVLGTILSVEISTITHSILDNTFSIAYAVWMPIALVTYVLVVLGFLALTMRFVIPKSFWTYNNKLFVVHKKEVLFLKNHLKINKWKDKIPEMGWTAGFPKSKIESNEVSYLNKFLQETCFAETMHFSAGILGFTALSFVGTNCYFFAFPILIVNFILNLLPCLIQRYNRYRLGKVYERKVAVGVEIDQFTKS